MRADPVMYLAYEYGTAVGMPASEVLKLPIAEFTSGFAAYRQLRAEHIEDAAHES